MPVVGSRVVTHYHIVARFRINLLHLGVLVVLDYAVDAVFGCVASAIFCLVLGRTFLRTSVEYLGQFQLLLHWELDMGLQLLPSVFLFGLIVHHFEPF